MEAKKTSHHENLLGTNSLVVRQNRFDSEGSLHAEINGKKHKVINYSLFGLGILADHEIAPGTLIDTVSVSLGSEEVAMLSFEVKRSKKSDFGYEIGLEAINNTVPVETIMRLKDFNSLVSNINEKTEHYKNLPAGFKITLTELSTKLENYEKYVKNFSEKEFSNSREYLEAKDSLISVVSKQVNHDLLAASEEMKNSFTIQDQGLYKIAFTYYREQIGKFLFQSPFTRRSFEKPRGYAGDFVMMSQIYANDGFATTLFGSCMERAVQCFGEPSAVRNRSSFLSEKIVKEVRSKTSKLKFLSVACGPAEEVRIALTLLTQDELDRCEFNLLDQDEQALQYAQKIILEHALNLGKKIKVNLLNRGIKEILISGLDFHKFDMIYSSGLFDYFTDPVASKACKVLHRHLNETGKLIIGNFNIVTTNWFGMLALFDWSLILRSASDLERLFRIEGTKVQIESEKNNINLFCVIAN